jgi:hypothetical protein
VLRHYSLCSPTRLGHLADAARDLYTGRDGGAKDTAGAAFYGSVYEWAGKAKDVR